MAMPKNMSAATYSGRGFKQVFTEEFDRNTIDRPGTDDWKYTLPGNVRSILGITGEKQLYVDPAFKTGSGYAPNINPFSVNNGVATLTAQKTTAEQQSKLGFKYTSGMLSSYDNAQLTYGFIEMRADLPKGQGFWPAFFLRGADQKVQGEIDLFEGLGHLPNALFQTVHYRGAGDDLIKNKTVRANVADTTAGMHTYGVDWNPQKIAFYFDGVKMGEMATPATMKIPMYMIANLAVGGHWVGDPNASTPWPGKYDIDYIRVWQDNAMLASQSKSGGAGNETLSGADGNDRISGGGGNDIVLGAGGNDVLDGGTGSDRTVGGFGNDTMTDGAGVDTLIGGKGDDRYVITDSGNVIVEFEGGGIDTVVTALSSFGLSGNLENLEHLGATAFRGVGNSAGNAITGGTGNDVLIGGAGNDTLNGGAGNDNLSAGIGNDRLAAGAGNDTLYGDAGNDVFVFRASDGVGRELIRDFRPGIDDLDLRDWGINTLAEFRAATVDTAAGATIKAGGETIVLQFLKEAAVTANDFVV